ncbi:HAD family hydrolase [Streptomyces sp. NPDC102406]|uniref:HAD family hydrolase n=1 Tax=Streptomyces sp. NPDC102406 TaxID=3366171 RepID=UPI003820F416
MPDADVILFDLGGVLFCDPWETLLLTPGQGLADRLGVPRREAEAVGEQLWDSFSVAPAEESDYWEQCAAGLGVPLPAELIRQVERDLLAPSPWAQDLIESAAATGADLGIASNNTSFWYARQATALDLDKWIDPALVYVSHDLGVTKGTPGRGLLDIAAEALAGRRTGLVEDREANLRRAAALGLRPLPYAYGRDGDRFPDFSASGVGG